MLKMMASALAFVMLMASPAIAQIVVPEDQVRAEDKNWKTVDRSEQRVFVPYQLSYRTTVTWVADPRVNDRKVVREKVGQWVLTSRRAIGGGATGIPGSGLEVFFSDRAQGKQGASIGSARLRTVTGASEVKASRPVAGRRQIKVPKKDPGQAAFGLKKLHKTKELSDKRRNRGRD